MARLASWWLWLLFYLVHTAGGVTLSIWLFVTGHWIVGSAVGAWTLGWTVRLFGELGLARVARRLVRLS
jgi:hypothetical protein